MRLILRDGSNFEMTSEPRVFARKLRQSSTRAEDILWAQLRGSRFHGYKFKRQVPFDGFVVDFFCNAARLIVELDGKQHDWFADYDEFRTKVLESGSLHAIRFTNEDVCGDLDDVLTRIKAEIDLRNA